MKNQIHVAFIEYRAASSDPRSNTFSAQHDVSLIQQLKHS